MTKRVHTSALARAIPGHAGAWARLLLALLLLSFEAGAETWYVRPASGEYGAEDGTSYATAFDGWLDIAWGAGAGQVGAGDTLVVCGEFRDNVAFASIGASGSSGNPLVIDGDCSSAGGPSRSTIVAGTGAVAFGAGTNTWLTLRNMELIGGTGVTSQIITIASTGAVAATAMNVVMENLYIHDTGGVGSSPRDLDIPCLRLDGSNMTITDVTIENCEGDGIYAEGNDHNVTRLTVRNIGLAPVSNFGDCVQYGNSTGSIENAINRVVIDQLNCDRTNNGKKHGVIFGCSTTGGQDSIGNVVRRSVINGALHGISGTSCEGLLVEQNFIIASKLATFPRGVVCGPSTGCGFTVQGNIFLAADAGYGPSQNYVAINFDDVTSAAATITNNTIVAHGNNANSFGVYFFSPATTTATVSNNAFRGLSNTAILVDAGATVTAQNNGLFSNAADCTGVTCTNSVTADPQFLGGPNPTTAEGFRLRANSPLAGAGTDLGDEFADYFGDTFYNGRWDIGAFRRDSCYRRSRDGKLDMARTRAQVVSRCAGIPPRYPEGL